MFVIAGPASPPRLEDSNEFRSLEVVWTAPGPPDASAIEPAGWLDGEHVWLNPKWMREQGREKGPDWELSFDKMVDYARNNGWVDANGFLRAHIVQKDSDRATVGCLLRRKCIDNPISKKAGAVERLWVCAGDISGQGALLEESSPKE